MNSYRDRLHKVIPGGAHTYSRGDDQFSKNAPPILERGKGAYVWDVSKNKFLDYGMGLRSVTLGYANDRVSNAAIEQIHKGVNLTRATTIELEAAELLVDLIPCAEMVKFAKNGSNVTTAAVKLARAYTQRPYIAIAKQHPFFSFDDWFIGATSLKRGIPEQLQKLTLTFNFNDINSLKLLFEQYPNQIAGVMLEPATANCWPYSQTNYLSKKVEENFLYKVKQLCIDEGALCIFDEMITGFRMHLSGAQAYFGIEPDLATFGKGMANGFPLAAVVGKREFMQLGSINDPKQERVFLLSSTHGSEMISLGAFLETMKIYHEENVIDRIWMYGKELHDGVNRISTDVGLRDYFFIEGSFALMNFVTKNEDLKPCLKFRTLFMQEMVKNNILMPWISVSLAHTRLELETTLDAVYKSLLIYKNALNEGIDKYLESESIKPVFRKFN